MQLPLQISFRNMERTEALETLVRERASRLDEFAGDIMSCRVVLEPAGKHHQRGNLYEVRIDLKLRGEEIAITRAPSEHTENRDIQVALRDAFDAARRKLEDYVRRRRGDMKAHEIPAHGHVARLFADEDYGFIETSDGRSIYFHRHSVQDGAFDRLQIGTEVSFSEEEGDKGSQASTVTVLGRHHHLA